MSILSAAQRGAAERLAGDLVRVFGPRLRLVAAYESAHAPAAEAGVVHTLALVDAMALQDLSALLTVVAAWHKAKLATPLLLSREEFERSLDVFPIEYQSILASHEVLHGAWPEPSVSVGSADLRRGCERQVKGHLIHLRESYLETHGRPSAVADLIRASAPALRSSLQNVARLHGVAAAADDELAAFAGSALSVDAAAVVDVLRFAREGQAADATALLPRYLSCVEQLWRAVDRG
ncbi:MAG TPA: hypothetical protein VK886_18005 [Vicinamibacterales bacterium]|nr:hypothetical protein [Vicinamibacterales bacterium]